MVKTTTSPDGGNAIREKHLWCIYPECHLKNYTSRFWSWHTDTINLERIWNNQCCIFSADVMCLWFVQAVLISCLRTQVWETCTVHRYFLVMEQLLFQRRLMRKKRESCTVRSCSIITTNHVLHFLTGPFEDESPCLRTLEPCLKKTLLGEEEMLLCHSSHLTAGGSISVEREEKIFSLFAWRYLYEGDALKPSCVWLFLLLLRY